MATDATGTPTSPDNIPTYNTAVDAPSGKGFNAAMAAVQTALSLRAPLASPALTGTPTAPTAASPTNTTQIATTAFVKAQNYIVTGALGLAGINAGTNHALVISGASTLGSLATGVSGQILMSGGASADPAWSTATYPSTAGTAGQVPRSNGTNFVVATLSASDITGVPDKTSSTPQSFTAFVPQGAASNTAAGTTTFNPSGTKAWETIAGNAVVNTDVLTIGAASANPGGSYTAFMTLKIKNTNGTNNLGLSWHTSYVFNAIVKPTSVNASSFITIMFQWDPDSSLWKAMASI